MPDKTATPTPKVFVQTATTPISELDRWKQMGEEEARMVYEMTLRNELSGGTEQVRAFEREFREMHGLKHAITTFNGTTALWSAMYGCYVGPGDEVICPVYTWICTISSALMLGARPVFCDVDPETMLIDPDDVRRKITKRTRAIICVHLWGWVCEMDELMAISRQTGIPIIEDCSHAHGAMYKGKMVGSVGAVGAWSMQGSKAVSAGEGGIVATDDDDIIDRAAMIGQCNRAVGLDLVSRRYERYQPLGFGIKFRSHPLGIGIARVQLKKLAKLNAGRGGYVKAIEAGLKDIPGMKPIPTAAGSQRGGYYSFPVMFQPEEVPGVARQQYIQALRDHGVPAGGGGYNLLCRLPLFSEGFDIYGFNRGPLAGDYPGCKDEDFPGAVKMYDRLISLPVLTDPVEGAADEVLRRIRAAVESLKA